MFDQENRIGLSNNQGQKRVFTLIDMNFTYLFISIHLFIFYVFIYLLFT